MAYVFDKLPTRREKLIELFLFAALLVATALSVYPVARLAVFAINQLCVVCILMLAFRGLAGKRQAMPKESHRRWLLLLALSALTHLAGALETLNRMLQNVGAPTPNERVFGLELFGLVVAVFAIYHLLLTLSTPKKSLSEEDILELFCSRYGLTAREAEMLPLLLKGAQNSEICEALFISLNTVKVHAHNIYQKLEIERRSQLSAKYAEFTRQYK